MDFLDDDLFSDDEVFHFFIEDWDLEDETNPSVPTPQELDPSSTFWDLIAAKLDPTGADGLRQRIHNDLKSRPQETHHKLPPI